MYIRDGFMVYFKSAIAGTPLKPVFMLIRGELCDGDVEKLGDDIVILMNRECEK